MSRMREGMAHLARRMKERVGEPFEYVRGLSTVVVSGWFGVTGPDTDARPLTPAVRLQASKLDVLFEVATLTAAGVELPPREGDRVAYLGAGGRETYEVQALDDEPCWRWSDPQHTTVRIHVRPVQ